MGSKEISSQFCVSCTAFPMETPKGVKIGAGITLLAIAAITAAYFLHPGAHAFLSHTFSTHLTVGQSIVYIALPLFGAAALTGLAIYARNKHRAWREAKFWTLVEGQQSICKLRPTGKELKIAGIAALTIGLIVLGGYAACHFAPSASSLLTHKLPLWQAIAYAGGGSASLIAIAALTPRCISALHHKFSQPTNNRWDLFI